MNKVFKYVVLKILMQIIKKWLILICFTNMFVDVLANSLVAANEVIQVDQSGTSTGGEGGDDDRNIIEHPEILSEVMNRVVETVNEMEDLMHNVIDRRIPNLRMDRYIHILCQNKALSFERVVAEC